MNLNLILVDFSTILMETYFYFLFIEQYSYVHDSGLCDYSKWVDFVTAYLLKVFINELLIFVESCFWLLFDVYFLLVVMFVWERNREDYVKYLKRSQRIQTIFVVRVEVG